MQRLLLTALFIAGALAPAIAQAPAPLPAAEASLAYARELPGFSESDLADLVVSHRYTDERLGVTYVYLQQRIGELPIDRAVASVALRDGEIVSFRETFEPDAHARLANVVAQLDDRRAVNLAAAAVGLRQNLKLRPSDRGVLARGNRRYTGTAELLVNDVRVEDIVFVDRAGGSLTRALAVSLDLRGGDYHRVAIDAATGTVLLDDNLTLHCTFEPGYGGHVHADACATTVRDLTAVPSEAILADGASYRVYAWPAESPNRGPQVVVADPADPEASPYGWHDTDGADGAEYTITRGNNTHAYVDGEDESEPSTPEPDGGPELVFDFPYDEAIEPLAQTDATTTNLFYVTNRFHDFTWHYGFDEEAGNFQENNYGRGGRAGDAVLAQGQDGSITNATGDGPTEDNLNNANFSTPSDGSAGRMQMYLFDVDNSVSPIKVSAPEALSGRTYGTLGAAASGWGDGAAVDEDTDVEAGVVFAADGEANPSFTDGCEALVTDVAGKIAVVDRGTCEFGLKAFQAQEAGALGIIICNFEEGVISLGGGARGSDVTIPTFMMDLPNCIRLRADVNEFPDFTLAIREPDTDNTQYVSGSLDNGIVAHEYGHGVSQRLTGGPSNTNCLVFRDNLGAELPSEQMGEGWSDFFTLVTTVRAEDDPDAPRGIGTYVYREPTDGPGIRPFPYTRDMDINPVTYGDVANSSTFSAPHGVGSIWASMLWDLHWNFVDEYGYGALDTDTLGNNKAIQLVMTGLKLQPCFPGFVDGRDAILAADRLLYGGRNELLIWETFARRGLGANADQGESSNRGDGVEDFTLPLELANRTFFTKAVTENVEPGGEVSVELTLANWVDSVPVLASVLIDDILPEGAALVEGSVDGGDLSQDGDVLSFAFADVAQGDTVAIRYRYLTPATASTLHWYEPIASAGAVDNFDIYNGSETAPTFWDFTDDGFGDDAAIAYVGDTAGSLPILEIFEERAITVQGDNPVFSFYHKYDINANFEGAFLEIRGIDQARWSVVGEGAFLRNGYRAEVPYQAFVIPLLDGFGPSQPNYEQTLVDLSAYAGQTILLRWRFGREGGLGETESATPGAGWTVDEMAQVDAVTYNTAATLTIGDAIRSVRAPGIGTFVTYGTTVGVDDVDPAGTRFSAFPNPTTGALSVRFDEAGGAGTLDVVSVTGQVVRSQPLTNGQSRVELDLTDVVGGVYAVRASRDGETSVVRVVVQ